ncbi:porin family protein [Lewinella cohaerens]|uniref:porin family protein n=1 Tax=Lewinella cohaerens TaxID=70995 RepID=UPI000368C11A|nr:porin family protein [Lewinella cohaerens]
MQFTKKITLAVLAIGMAFSLQAQVAVKAGVNFSNMLFEEDDNSIEDLAKNGATKFTAGVAFILPFSDVVALQPELLYTQKGAKSTYTIAGGEFTNDLTYNYLDIPLLLRISLGDTHGEGLGIYLNGGGYVGYAFNGKSKSTSPLGEVESDISFDDNDDQRRIDFGAAVGGGLTLGNLFFDLRYNHGINNILDDDANNNNDNGFKKLQHRGLALTAGIIF